MAQSLIPGGFFLPLGLTGSIAHILCWSLRICRWGSGWSWGFEAAAEKPSYIFKPAQGRISSPFSGNVIPFLGSLPQGYPNLALQERDGAVQELKIPRKKTPWSSQQGAAEPFLEPVWDGCKSRGMCCPSISVF